jgi:hypothetical protein
MSRLKVVVAALFCLSVVAVAQDEKRQLPGKDEKKQGMPTFTPAKEHQLLKQFDGDWEFTSKCSMPGQEPMEGKGTETVRMTYGGFWCDVEDKGVMAGKDWSGRGLIGWDPQKKKYCGVWVDSMTPYLCKFEGEADAGGKMFTFKTKGFDPMTNKEAEHRMVWEFKDQDHRTMKFFGKDDTGKEVLFSEVTYTRKPAMVK